MIYDDNRYFVMEVSYIFLRQKELHIMKKIHEKDIFYCKHFNDDYKFFVTIFCNKCFSPFF